VRDDMTPKPAYDELKRMIKSEWWTRTETTSGAGGQASFRGFLGDYHISTQMGGEKLTGEFQLDKTTQDKIDVRLKA